MYIYSDMRKVEILPQIFFFGSKFPQNSMIRDHLTLKGSEGGTWCPPLVRHSNYSIEMLIKRMETQCKFIFVCLGPKEKNKSVLSVLV